MDKLAQYQTLLKRHKSEQPSYSTYMSLSTLVENDGAELDLKSVNVAILSNYTIDPLLPIIFGEMGVLGVAPKPFVADFDTIPETVFDLESSLYQSKPDYIIISQWLETLSSALSNNFISLKSEQIENEITRLVKLFENLFSSIRSKSNAVVLVNNFPIPKHTTLGILDAQSSDYQTYAILKLNLELLNISKKFSDIYWVDHLGIFARFGYLNCEDEKHWQMARAPLNRNILIPLGQEYGKFFTALSGKSKKCLVLDCDNTLWGGVVGEDGLSGIKLGTSYPGQSFKDFQQEILNLYNRGVILALCSKNNEADVLEVLANHQDMLLKREHFTTWQINWNDKASNLEQIAQDLNIGIDSLVFVDDNPFECNLVRDRLPEVAVIELGKSPILFKSQLQSLGLFDSLTFSNEDQHRNKMYASDTQRKQIKENSTSLEDYLLSLEIKGLVGIATKIEIPRIAQLTQKTNQFNLTTRRYLENDILQYVRNEHTEVFYLQLKDRVSDLGIIGVGILNYLEKSAIIDTLLLSCRALGRGAENTLLALLINRAKINGCTEIIGEYCKTQKNPQVSDLYRKHHFILLEEQNDVSRWVLDLDSQKSGDSLYPKWIEVLPQDNLKI